jgi:hypothetical protein
MPGPRLRGSPLGRICRPRGRLAVSEQQHVLALGCLHGCGCGRPALVQRHAEGATAVLARSAPRMCASCSGCRSRSCSSSRAGGTRQSIPPPNMAMIAWSFGAALAQIAATAHARHHEGALVRRYHRLHQDRAGAGGRVRPGISGRQGEPRPGAGYPGRHRRRAHAVLAQEQHGRGLLRKPAAIGIGSGALFAIAAIGTAAASCRSRRPTSCWGPPQRWCWASSSRR